MQRTKNGISIKPVKIWENFKTIGGFSDTRTRKRCWQTCHNCQEKWGDTQTENVHMVTHQNTEHWINGNGSFFVCDDCLVKIKANGNNLTTV